MENERHILMCDVLWTITSSSLKTSRKGKLNISLTTWCSTLRGRLHVYENLLILLLQG